MRLKPKRCSRTLCIQRHRQVDHNRDGGDAEDQGDAVPQAGGARRPEFMQDLQATAECERQQHGDLDGEREPAETNACGAVISRPLVRREQDAAGELRRNRRPVRADVRDLPRAEPHAQYDHQGQRAKEHHRKELGGSSGGGGIEH